MINPGEKIPSHRHTPAQMRFIVKGTGAYTTSQGERMFMEPGDLLVQPNWTWHGTTNPGKEPVFWIDIQDRNLVNYLGAFRRDVWPHDDVEPAVHSENHYATATGLIRSVTPSINATVLAPTHYKWRDTVKAVDALSANEAANPYDGKLFEFTHPSNGGHTLPTLSAQLQLMPPSAKTQEHRHTGMTMYLVVKGEGTTIVNGTAIDWREHDCIMLPPWQWHAHRNNSQSEGATLFTVSDRPALEALGLYYEEGKSKNGAMDYWSIGEMGHSPPNTPTLHHSKYRVAKIEIKNNKHQGACLCHVKFKLSPAIPISIFCPERWTHRVPEKWRNRAPRRYQLSQRRRCLYHREPPSSLAQLANHRHRHVLRET